MNTSTPAIFTDGTEFFKNLAKTYNQHSKGLFILAPSGVGKSYFVNSQTQNDWIDGDCLWPEANADATSDEWDDDFSIVMETNNRCDVVTEQAKKQGFWAIGSSNHWLKPDVIVLPPWNIHKKYVLQREHTVYDGGAKEENFEGLKNHRKWIADWKQQGVPCFESVEEAASFLSTGKRAIGRSGF